MKTIYALLLAFTLTGIQAQAQSTPKPALPFEVMIDEAGESMEIEWDACLENSRLFIMDGSNRIINSLNLCEDNRSLNFKDLSPGVYNIRIEHYTGLGEKRIVKSLEGDLSRMQLLEQKPALQFSIYPNPAQNNISIASDECLENSILSIQDIQGRTVRYLKLCNNGYDVDVADLPQGVYFIKIEHYTGVGVQRLVKE